MASDSSGVRPGKRKLRRLTLGKAYIGPVLGACIVVATLALGLYYVAPLDRSIFVDAQTQTMRLRFGGAEPREWRIGEAVLCRTPPPSRNGDVRSSEHSVCGKSLMVRTQSAYLTFGPGTSIDLERLGDGPAQIRIVSVGEVGAKWRPDGAAEGINEVRLLNGDIIHWGSFSATKNQPPSEGSPVLKAPPALAFPFDGEIYIGADVSAADNLALLSGRYEMRERLLGRPRPELVSSGVLAFGDGVELVVPSMSAISTSSRHQNAGKYTPWPTRGTIGPRGDGASGFSVSVSSSGEAGTGLSLLLHRAGFEPTAIEPGWSGRVLADQVTYGLAILLTLAVSLLSAASHVRDLFAEKQPTENKVASNKRPVRRKPSAGRYRRRPRRR